MTEQEWRPIEKKIEKVMDRLSRQRFAPIHGALAYAAYKQLHSVWYWVMASLYGWECDNVSP